MKATVNLTILFLLIGLNWIVFFHTHSPISLANVNIYVAATLVINALRTD